MIDKITMYKDIKLDTNKFNHRDFKIKEHVIKDTGEIIEIYITSYNGIGIMYNPTTQRLKVRGRLIKISDYNNRVNNLDVLVKTNKLDATIDKLNKKIEQLIGYQKDIDIRYFKVSYIEICFNIKTSYVNEYITMFNSIFKKHIQQNKFKSYKNIVIEEGKKEYTSFYVTTNKQYEDNHKNNYAVNFYNKADQLKSLILKSHTDKKYKEVKVTEQDLKAAENILRLEVQCSYFYFRDFKKKFGIDKDDIILKTFIYNKELCKKILIDKYKFFIDKNIYNNFYSYQKAKEIIENSTLKPFTRTKKAVLKYLQSISQNAVYSQYKSYNTRKEYNQILSHHHISFYLIPKKLNIDELISPIELLAQYWDNLDVNINNSNANSDEGLENDTSIIEDNILDNDVIDAIEEYKGKGNK